MALPVMTIDGDVIAVHSHWTDDGSRIVTEATVHTPDGEDVVVSQLGGSVDGIGMITMPGPPMLAPGMKVAVAAHRDVDLALDEHVVLDSVKVIAYPPGYVRTGPTKAGNSLYWESGCVFVTVDDAGTTAIPGDQEFAIIDAAIAEWNDKTASCSYLTVVNEGRKAMEVGNDKVNLIKFRDQMWGRPASGNDPARSYVAAAAGITTAVYIDDTTSTRDGAIIDADIEINGVNFAVSVNQQSLGSGCKAELQNTLTHELGHLHGLEHPCLASSDPPRVDNRGNPVPLCSNVSPTSAIVDATMYNFQDCGETKKESLAPDDIQAICDIYPTRKDPGSCDAVPATGGGCCSASGSRSAPPAASLLLMGSTVLLLLRRRTPSRRA
ncbi:MAG TPA: hypothetical protein VHN14_31830 [Kofleriaceae bacterium]|jgi:hypothetical protein|nr:hypothetical protein [Kofleriaceae bacterium]